MSAIVVDAVVAPETVHELLEDGPNISWVFAGPSYEDDIVPDGAYDLFFFLWKKWPVLEERTATPCVQAKFVFVTINEEDEVTAEFEDGDRDVDWASIPAFI